MSEAWIEEVLWNESGLVPAIAQETDSGQILMMAWMNRESLRKTLEKGEAVYWSRSRSCLWHKGESSGHIQRVKNVSLDCDGDTILLEVEQLGGIACHTGRHHCFFRQWNKGAWWETSPVLKDPSDIYHA